jgi:beta-barrel assembly-enhancing protease
LGDFGAARKEIGTLRTKYPSFLQYQVAEADIELAAGNLDAGFRAYDYIYKNHSSTTWVVQHYADTLVANQQPGTALKILKPALKRHPKNPALNKLMATASGDVGDLVQAHRSMAEYYILNGNRHAAIEQLDIAERNAGKNYYALAAIKARKNEIKKDLSPSPKP